MITRKIEGEIMAKKKIINELEDVRYLLVGGKHKDVIDEAIEEIQSFEETKNNILKAILDNTYPGFDKYGQPVNIWKPDGFKEIEQLLKRGTGR